MTDTSNPGRHATTQEVPPTSCARAVRLVFESQRPIAAVAPDLGVHKEALRLWVRQAEADAGTRQDRLTTAERDDLARLRGEVKQLRKANQILKAVSVFFDGGLDPTRTEVGAFVVERRADFGVELICAAPEVSVCVGVLPTRGLQGVRARHRGRATAGRDQDDAHGQLRLTANRLEHRRADRHPTSSQITSTRGASAPSSRSAAMRARRAQADHRERIERDLGVWEMSGGYEKAIVAADLVDGAPGRVPARGCRAPRAHLEAWLAWASRSRLQPFVELARTIRRHRAGHPRRDVPHAARDRHREARYFVAR